MSGLELLSIGLAAFLAAVLGYRMGHDDGRHRGKVEAVIDCENLIDAAAARANPRSIRLRDRLDGALFAIYTQATEGAPATSVDFEDYDTGDQGIVLRAGDAALEAMARETSLPIEAAAAHLAITRGAAPPPPEGTE